MSDKCPGCGAEYAVALDKWECGSYQLWILGTLTKHITRECYRRQLAQRDERIAELTAHLAAVKPLVRAALKQEPTATLALALAIRSLPAEERAWWEEASA